MEGRQRANWFSCARNLAFTPLPNSKRSLVRNGRLFGTLLGHGLLNFAQSNPFPSAPIPSKTLSLTTKSRSLPKVLLRHWWFFYKVTKILQRFWFRKWLMKYAKVLHLCIIYLHRIVREHE
jgi:hypothetical protein